LRRAVVVAVIKFDSAEQTKMSRPLAYEYKGFMYNEQMIAVYSDDEDKNQFYVVPPSLRVATDAQGPKINVSICERLTTPALDGLANLVPYIPQDLMDALKKEYGPKIGPLPVASGGQVLITGANWRIKGIVVDRPWITDELSQEGLSPEQKERLKHLKSSYDNDGIQPALTDTLINGIGWAMEVPTLVGSNIGAEVPISFTALGADSVTRLKSLIDSGGVVNGEIVYYYIGTTRPWAMQITADLGRVHQYISENLDVGWFWSKADIYREVERMREQQIINITVWDENDAVTGKYKVERLLDMILSKIIDKAFNFYPNIAPNKSQAQAEGRRWWWFSGSYQRRESTVELSSMFNLKMTIHGKSEPIPVSMGLYVRVPKYGKCEPINLLHEARKNVLRRVMGAQPETLLRLAEYLHVSDENGFNALLSTAKPRPG
jgi:hypothetical protein